MTALILSIFILVGALALAWEVRAMAREMKGLDEDRKRDADMTKEIEKWRDGK